MRKVREWRAVFVAYSPANVYDPVPSRRSKMTLCLWLLITNLHPFVCDVHLMIRVICVALLHWWEFVFWKTQTVLFLMHLKCLLIEVPLFVQTCFYFDNDTFMSIWTVSKQAWYKWWVTNYLNVYFFIYLVICLFLQFHRMWPTKLEYLRDV